MRHRSILRLVAAAAAALILLITAACKPALPTSVRETVPPATQLLRTETETPGIQRETPAVDPPPSPGPTATRMPPIVERRDDTTDVAPTEAVDSSMETLRGAEEALTAAKADLAQRLGVLEEEIQVRSVAPVLWPDTSLGCPEPSTMYAQVVTPGHIILLEVDGETYRYHTDAAGWAILCPGDVPVPFPLIPMNRKEVDDGTPWMPVE